MLWKSRFSCRGTPPPRPNVFQILIRLRQAVDHPYLVIYSATKREGMTPAMAPQTLHPIAAPEIPPTDPSTITSSSSSAPASARSATSSGLAASVAVSRRLLGGRGPSGGVHVPGDTSSDSDSAEIPKHQSGLQANGMAGQDVFSGVGVEDEPDCDDADVCGICTEPAERPVSSECGHSFCRTWCVWRMTLFWLRFSRSLFFCCDQSLSRVPFLSVLSEL